MLKKNKSIALVMILTLLIVTSSCAPKNTQTELNQPAKTNTSWERKLCRSKLNIISSYGDFPDPDDPMIEMISPSLMSKEISFNTVRSPNFFSKFLTDKILIFFPPNDNSSFFSQ